MNLFDMIGANPGAYHFQHQPAKAQTQHAGAGMNLPLPAPSVAPAGQSFTGSLQQYGPQITQLLQAAIAHQHAQQMQAAMQTQQGAMNDQMQGQIDANAPPGQLQSPDPNMTGYFGTGGAGRDYYPYNT